MADRAVTEGRRVALSALEMVRKGEFADRALARWGDRLDSRDHAWVQELLYGTLRLRGRLDFVLAAFARSGLDSLEPGVLDILRLGAYQILEMGGVPAYAAVSQMVELAKESGVGRASGLVNGVLQTVRRDGREVAFPALETDPRGHLSTWGSHPVWLIDRWLARWGVDETLRLVEINNRRPDLYLRPVDPTAAAGVLEEAGISVEPVAGFPDSLRLRDAADLARTLSLAPSVVQDPAAAMVGRYAAVPPGSLVVDLTAAPGGKTVGLAADGAQVVASDLSLGRMRRVRSNVERAGLDDRVAMVVADGRFPPFRTADAVLLDAPCTGTGTLRRHPDARWRVGPNDLLALARLQRELLDAAAMIVREGGLLVYSTCSIEPEENRRQVEDFLRNHAEFELVPPLPDIDEVMMEDGFLNLLPQRLGVDGAFAARLVRK